MPLGTHSARTRAKKTSVVQAVENSEAHPTRQTKVSRKVGCESTLHDWVLRDNSSTERMCMLASGSADT